MRQVFHVKHSVRQLADGDEAAVESFLGEHAASSMFLRSNLRRVGFVDRGEPYQGAYFGAFDGAAITGVAGHFWNGMILVQAPGAVERLAAETVAASGRRILGISGQADQVTRTRRALGLEETATATESNDDLFSLDLSALRIPAALGGGDIEIRRPDDQELGLLADWSAAFHREALGFADGAELRRNCRDQIARLQLERAQFVLVVSGEPVAYAAFNATLPDIVQLGGVWTPPEQRGRGYGRAVVAGALLTARSVGVRHAVLFTDTSNGPAQAAYRSLGFERVGDYGLVIFA